MTQLDAYYCNKFYELADCIVTTGSKYLKE